MKNLRPAALGAVVSLASLAAGDVGFAQEEAPPDAVEPEGPAIVFEEPPPYQLEFILNSTVRYQIDDGNVAPTSNLLRYDPVGEDFRDIVTTFGGSITWEEFIASVRFDTAVYGNEAIAAPDATQTIKQTAANRFQDQLRVEYISATYASKGLELTLGDYYATLGRGLILAIRKEDDVGVDNKLRGIDGKIDIGDLTFNAFAGFLNIRNYEPGTGFFYEEPNDFIAGGRIEYGFGKYLKLGAHAAYHKPDPLENGDTSENVGYAASIELPRPVKWASFYFEGAQLRRFTTQTGEDREETGVGLYGSSNLYAGPLTILLEGKWYDNLFQLLPRGRRDSQDGRQLVNRLQEPPTAERPLAIILTNQDVKGGRIRLDYSFGHKFVPFVSFGRYRDTFANSPNDVTSLFGGARFGWGSGHGVVNFGYRGAFLTENEAASLLTRDWHLIADIAQKLFAGLTGEIQANGRHAAESAGSVELTEWVEGRTALTISHTSGVAVTGAWEMYTKSPDIFKQNYFSVAAQWEFKKGSFLRALAGGERAGLKCSGGACRFFPGFEGARLELNLRL